MESKGDAALGPHSTVEATAIVVSPCPPVSFVSWDIIEQFSMASLMDLYQLHAPTIWRILLAIATSTPGKSGKYRPKEIVSFP